MKKMITHKKPIDATPSKLITQFAEEIAKNSVGTIVDVACGYGRNATYISSFGVPVICVDINDNALEYIRTYTNLPSDHSQTQGLLTAIKLDSLHDPWPFANESVGAIINIHFFHPTLIEKFVRSIKSGGLLLIETIDGHGGNYLHLPRQGFIKTQLRDMFDIKYFKEKKVGPLQSNAATVKLLAVKRKHYNVNKVADDHE